MAEAEAAAAAPVEEEEAHTETSYLLLSLFPSFPSPAAANGRRCLLSAVFFFFYFFSRGASPRPVATPAVFQPLEQRFIFIAMFCPLLLPPFLPPVIPTSPRSTSTTAPWARLLFIRLAPAFFPLLFSPPFFLHRSSRCPWSVISRRGGDENARLGLRTVASSFCTTELPPSAPFSPAIRFFFFFRFFHVMCARPAVLISRVRALRSRDKEKY